MTVLPYVQWLFMPNRRYVSQKSPVGLGPINTVAYLRPSVPRAIHARTWQMTDACHTYALLCICRTWIWHESLVPRMPRKSRNLASNRTHSRLWYSAISSTTTVGLVVRVERSVRYVCVSTVCMNVRTFGVNWRQEWRNSCTNWQHAYQLAESRQFAKRLLLCRLGLIETENHAHT